jgi:hypothetical protein
MPNSHAWEELSPELAALPRDSPEYRADLNRRVRLAFLAGAEEWAQIIHDRGLTDDEVREALRGYPGDLLEAKDPGRGGVHRGAGWRRREDYPRRGPVPSNGCRRDEPCVLAQPYRDCGDASQQGR